jgi:integrase
MIIEHDTPIAFDTENAKSGRKLKSASIGSFTHPEGKTPKATRFVGMSDRMFQMLSIWCDARVEGWVFPSRSKSGHLESIAKGFQAARKNAKLDPRIVPYSARHTYGTFTMAATGNVFAVSKSMGHADIKSMAPYQHQDVHALNDAINERNRERGADLPD